MLALPIGPSLKTLTGYVDTSLTPAPVARPIGLLLLLTKAS